MTKLFRFPVSCCALALALGCLLLGPSPGRAQFKGVTFGNTSSAQTLSSMTGRFNSPSSMSGGAQGGFGQGGFQGGFGQGGFSGGLQGGLSGGFPGGFSQGGFGQGGFGAGGGCGGGGLGGGGFGGGGMGMGGKGLGFNGGFGQ